MRILHGLYQHPSVPLICLDIGQLSSNPCVLTPPLSLPKGIIPQLSFKPSFLLPERLLELPKRRQPGGHVLLRARPLPLDAIPRPLDASLESLDPCRALDDFRFDISQSRDGAVEIVLGGAQRVDEQ